MVSDEIDHLLRNLAAPWNWEVMRVPLQKFADVGVKDVLGIDSLFVDTAADDIEHEAGVVEEEHCMCLAIGSQDLLNRPL